MFLLYARTRNVILRSYQYFNCIVLTKIMLQQAVFAVTAIAKNKHNSFEQKSNYYNMDYNPIGPIICLILTGGESESESERVVNLLTIPHLPRCSFVVFYEVTDLFCM